MTHEETLDTFHQPFDAPADGWDDRLEDSPLEVPSTYFTLVADGRELSGGSIRIHQPDLLSRVLRMVGQADTNDAVVEALRYGAPPTEASPLRSMASLRCSLESDPSGR